MKNSMHRLAATFVVFVGISNFFSTVVSASRSEVILRVNITSTRKLILNCEVPASASTTHLYCPLTGNSPCFLDCIPSCILVGGRCKPLEELKTTYCQNRQEGNKIITTYTLDATDRKNKGEWYCVHGGKRSSGFILNVDKLLTTKKPTTTTRPPTTTTRKPTTTTTTTTKAPAVIVSRPTTRMSSYEGKEDTNLLPIPKPESEDDLRRFQEYQDVEVKHLTRPDLVIAILSLLALSLIVNLAFCIRCILVRKFIEIQRAGAKDSACLTACLCIPNSQPSLQAPKVPRDCIYEEITSPSSGPRRRPSNCSSTMRTFSTGLDGQTPTFDGRSSFTRRGSMPRSRTFPVKAMPIPAQTLHQRPSYIYVAATENGDMLLEPVLTAASRVSSQQLYDDVASEGLQSLTASTNAIYARVQKASHQLQQRQAHQQLQQHLHDLHEQQQNHEEGRGRKQTDSLPPPLPEQQEEETTPLTGSPVHSQAEPKASSEAGTERSRGSSSSPANPDSIRNNSRLELSKSLLQKADTLLREAGCLLD